MNCTSLFRQCHLLVIVMMFACMQGPSAHALAQSILPPGDEIQVSDSACTPGQPEVAVSPGGRILVKWNDAGRLLSPDLRFDGTPGAELGNRHGHRLGSFPYAVSDTEWTLIDSVTSYSYFDGGTGGLLVDQDWFATYRLMRYRPTAPLTLIDGIVWTLDYYRESNITERRERIVNLCCGPVPDAQFVAYCRTKEEDAFEPEQQYDLWKFGMPTGAKKLLFRFGKHVRNASDSYAAILSPVSDSSLAFGIRAVEPNGQHTFQYMVFDTSGTASIPLSFVDTIGAACRWQGMRLMMTGGARVWWVLPDTNGSSLIVREIQPGGIASPKRPLLDRVRNGSEYSIKPIRDDLAICVWTSAEANGSTDIFARLLDASMQWISAPVRLNSDTLGAQILPSIALHGDTVYAVWLDSRTGIWQTRLRKFVVGSLTGVSPGITTPVSPRLDQNYPNPFGRMTPSGSSVTIITYALPRTAMVDLRVYDALGRNVACLQREFEEGGEHSVHFDAGDLPAGMYHTVLETCGVRLTNGMVVLQ